ncbi:peptidoglycan-associated lipoprotein Pal [Teredinibacter sp. KSP-S5-2]|uniref:peptidoglycan-associated lipoprotein Pal n=1 Tax=Teredinibacter sp. KSP-S5-2 TaxID=3034506 RepID=UPI002934DDAF|nr:peptidoglycan-associated lipoprotein Pal [Teredinibacter sp. KSP-S5-2]WNO08109.1 peptidoglycan-associated lipoprotein Pal [Teredinibacter sp. KSP-S5-2]
MTKTLKIFLAMIAVMSLLAGCSSNTQVEDDASATDSATESTDQGAGADLDGANSMENAVDLSGVDTVFYFDFDQSILRSESRSALMLHAEALKAEPRNVRLEGHADERGSREYNMALGERRANAVRDFLVLQGVDSNLIETVSYGEERPAEVGSYDSAWSKNRRVELK